MKPQLPLFEKNSYAQEQCFGCGACAQVCPSNAIQMELDSEGFLYPSITENICTGCGLCVSKCPAVNPKSLQHQPKSAYMAWHTEKPKRLQSTSGGVFQAIAEDIIKQGGIVFGATFSPNWELGHSSASNTDALQNQLGSKYAQSDTYKTYLETQNLLKTGKTVYYCGTPCQIAGLHQFLKKTYDNLLTSDVICHGTPSNELFKREIRWKEHHQKDHLIHHSFRSKSRFGWGIDTEMTWRHNGIKYEHSGKSPYLEAFLQNLSLRPSCYSCPFSTQARPGDITLGDFWNVNIFFPKERRNFGISLVFVNTEKALQVLPKIKHLFLQQLDMKQILEKQERLQRPVKRPKARTDFYRGAYQLPYTNFIKEKNIIKKKKQFLSAFKTAVKILLFYKYWK